IMHLVTLLVAANDVLERGRDKEVFLSQPELTADEDVVVWIEHTADVLRAGARFDGADVVALVELVEIELLNGAGTPQAQAVHPLRRMPGDRGVERGGEDVTGVDPCVAQTPALVGEGMDAAVELDAEAIAEPRDLPGIAVAQPRIRNLDLRAVDDPLMEDAVVIAEPVAIAGVPERRQRIEEARGEAPEAAIAESSIPFRLSKVLQAIAQCGQRVRARTEQVHRDQAVSQRPPHEVLERYIVDALWVSLVVFVL